MLGSRLKKIQRKNKTSMDIDTILNEIPSPSILVSVPEKNKIVQKLIRMLRPQNTLPFQIPRAIWHTPGAILSAIKHYRELKQEQQDILLQYVIKLL